MKAWSGKRRAPQLAMRRAVGFLGGADNLPEGFGYTLKRRLLGPPMVNEELSEQRLSNVAALGVLAPDPAADWGGPVRDGAGGAVLP
jgi:hypothetical protein